MFSKVMSNDYYLGKNKQALTCKNNDGVKAIAATTKEIGCNRGLIPFPRLHGKED